MAQSQTAVVPSLAPIPCPAYLIAAHETDDGWKVASYRVLFAQHDGDRAKLLVCHPSYGGLVTAEDVSTEYPAILLIDPTEEEMQEARLLVRAKAVASRVKTGIDASHAHDSQAASPGWGGPSI